jgi:drug/metabolite transporter (DMT)-like permease
MTTQVQGILWMMLTGFLSVSIYTLARQLGAHYHPTQVVFFYSFLGFVCFLPYVVVQRVSLKTQQGALFAVRSVLEFSAFSLSFTAITQLPFAVHATLEFTAPLFGSVLAIVVLKEPSHTYRWVALVMGFVGVLIVTRPDISGFSSAALVVLAAEVLFACCGMCIKTLTRSEPPARIACYMLGGTALVAAPVAWSHGWQASPLDDWQMLLLLGALVAGVQFAVAKAFSKADMSLILPFFFLNLLWASIYGYLIFDESLSGWTMLGAVFIIGGSIYAGRCASRGAKDVTVAQASEQAIVIPLKNETFL